MTYKHGIHTPIAIEPFFKRKDHQSFADVFFQQPYAPLPPGPKLRAHVIDNGNSPLMHFPRNPPVESGRINHDGEVRFASVGFGDELVKKAPNFRQMVEDFRNADNSEIFGIHKNVASGRTHALPASAKELNRFIMLAQSSHELRTINFT